MDLSLKTEAWQQENQEWLGSAHGTSAAQSVTLDAAKFTAATHFPDGYLKSGVALGKVTTGGLYGPYDNTAVDGRETLVGFLFTSVEVKTPTSKPVGAILLHGIIREAKLPHSSGAGAVDAAGKTELAGSFRFI